MGTDLGWRSIIREHGAGVHVNLTFTPGIRKPFTHARVTRFTRLYIVILRYHFAPFWEAFAFTDERAYWQSAHGWRRLHGSRDTDYTAKEVRKALHCAIEGAHDPRPLRVSVSACVQLNEAL